MYRPLSVIAVVVLSIGCQSRLNEERKFVVQPGGTTLLDIDGAKYDRKVKLTLTTDQPVDVDVYLKKNAPADGSRPKEFLGTLKKSSGGDLEVSVPAKETFVIEINGGPKTSSCVVKIEGK